MKKAPRRVDYRLERFRALMVAFSITLFALVAQAQQPSTRDNTQQSTPPLPPHLPSRGTGSRRIQAVRISDAIKIDGLLDELPWSLAQPATDFLQEQPNEGEPASEKTEVRFLFNDKNLYIGIRAFDSEAKRINARELVRDAEFSNDDTVAILLDTYDDRRNAFR